MHLFCRITPKYVADNLIEKGGQCRPPASPIRNGGTNPLFRFFLFQFFRRQAAHRAICALNEAVIARYADHFHRFAHGQHPGCAV